MSSSFRNTMIRTSDAQLSIQSTNMAATSKPIAPDTIHTIYRPLETGLDQIYPVVAEIFTP